MSAHESMGVDEVTETMALLSQHTQVAAQVGADATISVGHEHGSASQRRQEVALHQSRSEGEVERQLWDNFEIHRRSAVEYLNQYLDCLQHVRESRTAQVYEIDGLDAEIVSRDVAAGAPTSDSTHRTREEWRLKISRDSLARDLLRMHETLDILKLKAAPSPGRRSLPVFVWSIPATMSSYMLWLNSWSREAITLFAASVAGLTIQSSSILWQWMRTSSIEGGQTEVKALFRLLNKGEIEERDRGTLEGWSFRMLEHFRK